MLSWYLIVLFYFSEYGEKKNSKSKKMLILM